MYTPDIPVNGLTNMYTFFHFKQYLCTARLYIKGFLDAVHGIFPKQQMSWCMFVLNLLHCSIARDKAAGVSLTNMQILSKY